MTSRRAFRTNRQDRRDFLQAAAAIVLAGNLPFAALAQAKMKIGTLGSGRVGSAIGGAWVKAGHQVMFSSLDLEADRKLAASLGGGARAGTPREAAAFGDVILVSVPYKAMPALNKDVGDLVKGKIIIDTSNPIVARDGDMAVAARALVRDVGYEPVLVGSLAAMGKYLIPGTPLAGERSPEEVRKVAATLR